MKTRIPFLLGALVLIALVCASLVHAGSDNAGTPSPKKGVVASVAHSDDAAAMRLQGEQRYRANCGRCHAAPRKFPPRMMATVLRHMRVRATITDQDMRLVLFYMSQ
jgi:cytochrome c5